jgi:two-component system probable response regulator PhcQ
MDQTYDYKRFAILYVDDEEKSLKQFTRALSDTFRIYTAPNATEGLTLLNEHLTEIGVVMSDQRMPGIQGVQLLERTRQLQPRIIRILATAYTDIEAAVAAVNTGAIYKYVSKPWDVAELEITLKHSLQFFVVQRERDLLLGEKLSVLHKLMITDRVLGLGVLASGLGHHLRNSMAAIRTFLDLTPEMLHRERVDLDRLQHPSFWHDFHLKVQERIKGVVEVLDGMSQFTRPPEPLFQTEVRLHELVGQALELLRPEFQERKIAVSVNIPADLPVLKVDGNRFPRLFELLFRDELSNLQPGARVEISARLIEGTSAVPAEIELILNDNGPGLPEDSMRSVFDPFFVRTDKQDEFGIYLMACFFIVHHHGGRIEVRSRPEGGLQFSIHLPVQPPASSPPENGGDFLARVMTNERLWEKLLTT